MKCKRCGDPEFRIGGYCSVYCQDLAEVEEDRDALRVRIQELEAEKLRLGHTMDQMAGEIWELKVIPATERDNLRQQIKELEERLQWKRVDIQRPPDSLDGQVIQNRVGRTVYWIQLPPLPEASDEWIGE